MAISLDELKEGKPLEPKKANLFKNKSLRPWESHNDQDVSTRTIGAVEAVKKAQKIVLKNEEVIATLNSKMKDSDMLKVTELLDTHQMRERLAERLHASEQLSLKSKQIRKDQGNSRPPGLINFIRHILS